MIHAASVFYIFLLVGLTEASESGIFGGKISKPHSRPYMASLQYRGAHTCGGILVRKDFVLTAAHCQSQGDMMVVLGAHNLSKVEESHQTIKVAKFFPHPKYTGKFDFDIMLLKVDMHCQKILSQFSRGAHTCGGILIREDFVLTAAYCKSDQLRVILGAHDLNKEEKSQQRIKVAEYHRHQNYNGNFTYDIMLLKLANKAKLNKNVQLLELPKKEKEIPANLECLVAGWGKTGRNKSISTVLKEATEMTQFKIECDTIWKENFTSQQMICTKFNKKKGGICQGDSGGPLICKNKLQGIAAFTAADQCDNPKYPHAFTKVSFFLSWINKIMHK